MKTIKALASLNLIIAGGFLAICVGTSAPVPYLTGFIILAAIAVALVAACDKLEKEKMQ